MTEKSELWLKAEELVTSKKLDIHDSSILFNAITHLQVINQGPIHLSHPHPPEGQSWTDEDIQAFNNHRDIMDILPWAWVNDLINESELGVLMNLVAAMRVEATLKDRSRAIDEFITKKKTKNPLPFVSWLTGRVA